MDIKIIPSKLKGRVNVPKSNSVEHRMLISAALADGNSEITNITDSEDISATIDCLKALGAEIEFDGKTASVKGISSVPKKTSLNCRESGSTLRFLIPLAAALGVNAEFIGHGRLPERPITPYLREMSKKGVAFTPQYGMPFEISGQLGGGIYELEGDISSQFITGLLFVLPLCTGDSQIKLLSPLESKPYADITVDCLNNFGVKIEENKNGYFIRGNQSFQPHNGAVEGDYSQAAFYFCANALGSNVEIGNLSEKTLQGDKKVLEIISDMGYNDKRCSDLEAFCADASDIPDLVPILTVLGCMGSTPSRIINAKRLKIKESNRLKAIADAVNALGGNVEVFDDSLLVHPVKSLRGGTVDSCNDHRIVMSAAIASTICREPVIIKNAQAVKKSYPEFFVDFEKLGGNVYVINME